MTHMTQEQALQILIQTAVVAQKAGALSLDDAVQVRTAIGVFQKAAEPVEKKEVVTPEEYEESNG